MSREILLLVDVLAREKNVSKEVVFGALEMALASASKKRIHDDADVRVSVDRETGDFETFRRWAVVAEEDYLNENNQTPLSEAQEQDPEVEVGDFLEEAIEPVDFGRIGAQAAKQVILQKVRDAEREQVLAGYGIELVEIERKCAAGGVISASVVRDLIARGDTARLADYREQVAGYCRAVAGVFPGRAVRGALIFADGSVVEVD